MVFVIGILAMANLIAGLVQYSNGRNGAGSFILALVLVAIGAALRWEKEVL